MRIVLTIALCTVLSACGGAQTAPLDIVEVRTILTQEISTIITGINREDVLLCSQPISPRFEMNSNIAVRYHPDGWAGTGISKFREFFGKAFTRHANIDQRLDMYDVNLTGDVAYVRVENNFVSTRTDVTPPENYTAAGWDWLVFELDHGEWLLIRWDEAPDPAPEPIDHEAGTGSDT